MTELLAQLYLFLFEELIKTEKIINSIHLLDDYGMGDKLKANHMPALVITPMNEQHETGPAADTAREIFGIRLRIIGKSVSEQAYQIKPLENTATVVDVNTISDKIKTVLYGNKRLTQDIFEMRPKFTCRFLSTLFNGQSGHFTAKDIFIEYTRLELYTGMQNDQDTIQPPDRVVSF